MTREQAKKLIPIMQAWVDGKTVQYRRTVNDDDKIIKPDEWHSVVDNDPRAVMWDGSDIQWRIKPEPRDFWIGWCQHCGPIPKVYGSKPERECAFCEIVRVREVIDP